MIISKYIFENSLWGNHPPKLADRPGYYLYSHLKICISNMYIYTAYVCNTLTFNIKAPVKSFASWLEGTHLRLYVCQIWTLHTLSRLILVIYIYISFSLYSQLVHGKGAWVLIEAMIHMHGHPRVHYNKSKPLMFAN